MKFQLGAMSVGDILDRGLKLTLNRLGAFYAVNLIVLSPLVVLAVLQPLAGGGAAMGVGLLVVILSIVLPQIASAATLRIISQEYADRHVTPGDAIQFAMGRFGPLLGTSLLAGLLIVVGSCLIIPGLLFAVWYCLASQVVVVEGLSGMPALNRSKDLTAGYRWRIVGIFLLVILLLLIVSIGIVGALSLVLPPGEYTQTVFGPVLTKVNFVNHLIDTVAGWLLNIAVSTYATVCITLVYFDLRVRKEGFDLELAAQKQGAPAEQA
jgi:hypothetical protein